MRKDDAEISDWDVADYLKTEKDVRYFLEEVLNANDPKLCQMALGDVARSAGMAKIAKKAGLNRESLYKALKEDAHPRFETVMRVLNAMGMKLSITPCVAEKGVRYSAKKEKVPLFNKSRRIRLPDITRERPVSLELSPIK